MIKIKGEIKGDMIHEFTYEVNEHGHVLEVITRRSDGHRISESMVYGLDTDDPYTRWHGDTYYLPEDGIRKAREARDTYRAWKKGHKVEGDWSWEEVD